VRTVAKPDLKDGYFLIAYELMAAVAAAGFNRGAQIVLCEVFAQIYGLAKRKEAVLSPSDIAHRTKYDRSNLIRSIRELTKANVLVNVGEVRYRFNKDYETWKLNETPEQRSLRLAYSRFAPTLAKSFAYDKLVEDHQQNVKRLMEEPPEGCVNSDTGDQSHQQTSCVNSDTPSVSNLTHPSHRNTSISNPESIRCNDVTSLEAMRCDFPPLTIPPVGIEKGDSSSPTANGDGGAVIEHETCTTSPNCPPDSGPLFHAARYPGATPVDQLIAWVRDIYGDRADLEGFSSSIHNFVKSNYPPDWIEDAISDAIGNPGCKFASYVNGCLRRRRERGGSRSPSPPVNSSSPPRETYQQRTARQVEASRRLNDVVKDLDIEENL
jgi:hypothetical protein